MIKKVWRKYETTAADWLVESDINEKYKAVLDEPIYMTRHHHTGLWLIQNDVLKILYSAITICYSWSPRSRHNNNNNNHIKIPLDEFQINKTWLRSERVRQESTHVTLRDKGPSFV